MLSPARPLQNASQDLLGEALAQHIRQQIDTRGDHKLSHYGLDGPSGHRMGTSHVSVLGEDGSAVAATSTINTPYVPACPQAPLLCSFSLFYKTPGLSLLVSMGQYVAFSLAFLSVRGTIHSVIWLEGLRWVALSQDLLGDELYPEGHPDGGHRWILGGMPGRG